MSRDPVDRVLEYNMRPHEPVFDPITPAALPPTVPHKPERGVAGTDLGESTAVDGA